MNYIEKKIKCVLGYFGVTLSSWGYPGVSLGNQTDPLNLQRTRYSFHKNLLIF